MAKIPKYRVQEGNKVPRGFVEVAGKRKYFPGEYGSDESKEAYFQFCAELQAVGTCTVFAKTHRITVSELILAFHRHAAQYYRKRGKPTREPEAFKSALRPLKKLYAAEPADSITPLCLKAVREEMINAEWKRTSINKQINRIRLVYRWAVENEMLPVSVYQALKTVSPLKKHRTRAIESNKVKPVPEGIIAKTLKHCPPTLAAMIELQQYSGARPGEICNLRAVDIDTTGAIWVYIPPEHKTEHHDCTRVICFGPRCQKILEPFLTSNLEAYLFSPRQARAERNASKNTHRRKNQKTNNRKTARKVREKYDTYSYRRAIKYACKLAEVDNWAPNQLRHTYATVVRKVSGIEAAQVSLGHSSLKVTEIYAEQDLEKAKAIAWRVG